MSGSVILSGARTPIGKLSGSLGSLKATDLAAITIVEALRRANLSGEQVDYVLLGQVLQAGQGQAPARQASVAAGIPMTVPSATINKVCLSGLNTIHLADLMIRAGEADIIVAGGMESMTNAPYLLPDGRKGFGYGDNAVLDAITVDGLTCALEHLPMGGATERYASMK